jgi:hypothetical protein
MLLSGGLTGAAGGALGATATGTSPFGGGFVLYSGAGGRSWIQK